MLKIYQFKAFDTDIEICVNSDRPDNEKLFQTIENDARHFEQQFSRFALSSELNQINHRKNNQAKVSPQLLKMLLRAQQAFHSTNGIFDPTIYSALVNSGYDQSFNLIKETEKKSAGDHLPKNHPQPTFSFEDFLINQKQSSISAPPELKIDLGGIAKGFWVDQMATKLKKFSQNYWISAGGDIFLQGQPSAQQFWSVALQNPLKLDEDLLLLHFPTSGLGVATSGINKRQGLKNGKKWTHLIDPRRGRPVRNSILSVTAIAPTTTDADILAKTVLILGIKKGLAWVNRQKDCACLIVNQQNKIYISPGLKKFL